MFSRRYRRGAMSGLILKLCGDVHLTAPGGEPFGRELGAKSLALLAFLALEPGPHQRDALATLLWSEYPEDKAKASLRQALTHLRDALGESLHTDRSTVELRGPLTCDVNEFLRLARDDPWQATLIDAPRFLASVTIRGAPAFDDWADEKRRALVERYVQVVAGCAREAKARGDWREAARVAARWTEFKPLADDAVAALMESQYLAGDRDAALLTHSLYLARVTEAPGRAITQLAERIARDGDAAANAPPRARETWIDSAPTFRASLAGRAHEWEALRRAWSGVASVDKRGGVVVIEGDAGAGKSRLAEDFFRWVTSQGGVVLRGRSYDVRVGAPFGAAIELLRSAVDAPGVAGVDPEWLAEIARVLPEVRRRFGGLPEPRASDAGSSGGADSWRLFEAITQVITAIAEDSPVAVLVDDLQWCDAESCGLLQSLVRRLSDVPVLWCVTFTPGSIERDAPAAQAARALRATPHAVPIVLGPLHEEDVWRMIRELGRVDGPTGARRLAARIHGVTAGNPFYVIELLKTLFARELLAVDPASGGWIVQPSVLTTANSDAFAPSVHETIAERIECLRDELQALLITIAVAGRCGTDVMSHAHGISRLRAAALGDALVERHLVVEEKELYQCAHPVIAHVVRQGLSQSRRAEVHRALALALEMVHRTSGSEDVLGPIARHSEHAGERAMAYRYAVLVAESSCARQAFDEALAWIGVAAASAATTEEAAATTELAARVLRQTGSQELPPRRPRISVPLARMEEGDLDLPARA